MSDEMFAPLPWSVESGGDSILGGTEIKDANGIMVAIIAEEWPGPESAIKLAHRISLAMRSVEHIPTDELEGWPGAMGQHLLGHERREAELMSLVAEVVAALDESLDDSRECLNDEIAKWGTYRQDRIKRREAEIAKRVELIERARATL